MNMNTSGRLLVSVLIAVVLKSFPGSGQISAQTGEYGIIEEIDVRVPMRDGVRPVSYTHLRAHETVLDIVCRLLLEKKKNN